MFRKQVKFALAMSVVVGLGVAASQSASAAFVNPSFENGVDPVTGYPVGYNSVGNVSVQLANPFSFIASSPDGSASVAFLSNNTQANPGSSGATTNISSLDTFAGLAPNTLENQGVKSGSAIQQTFTANAGDVITFQYKFGTNDVVNPDFAFVTLAGNGSTTFSNFINSMSPGLSSPVGTPDELTDFGQGFVLATEPNYLTETVTVGAAGVYTLTIGVTNVNDQVVTSGLVVDNIVQAAGPAGGGGGGGSGVPLPAGMYLMPLGLAAAGVFAKKYRPLSA